tara:strand:+ start:327 stop:512 length:186 start_codon:yes stop_codon:yes gene_type:complete
MNIASAKYYKKDGKNITIKCVVSNSDMENSTDIWVPIDENNRHYQELLKWVDAGNTIEEAD